MIDGNDLVEKLRKATKPTRGIPDTNDRSLWWWVLMMPGKVLLWFEYMFPERFSGIFGSARRKDIPIIQFGYSVAVYGLLLFVAFIVLAK